MYYVLEFSLITIYHVYREQYNRAVTTKGARNYWAAKTFKSVKLTYDVIAPEGTRSRTRQLNPFKKGGFMVALQTNAIIIPIGIWGTERVLPPDAWRSRIGGHVEVHIEKPIDTSNYTIEDRDALMEKVRKEINVLGGYDS
ncbi:MAG: 1-acyl-sn-glycerol-3-phosphate acyltransferase [Desulfobacteraceae bacterium]|nr:1-acyl-sn-glycerol-3-phosphate acyltransferase [Desulfobacteraceae bacterium]MBC2754994.1 1-acyl-sn-glycerol-3-phosphate acyltransferase [Desulfobacteraceae bacterium]